MHTTAEVTSISTNFKDARKDCSALLKVNHTLQHVQEALQKALDTNRDCPSRSLLLKQSVFDRISSCFLREIIGYLHRDDAVELEQALRRQFPNSDEAQSALVCLIHVATVYGPPAIQRNILKRLRSTPARYSSLAPRTTSDASSSTLVEPIHCSTAPLQRRLARY